MKIRDIFSKDIFRHINGVVKAGQQDEAIIWQELDEYVVTRELDDHFRTLLKAYLADGIEAGDSIGVWISGFFGSGKSHFLKILSYILENRRVINPQTRETKHTMDFFEQKIKDPMLLGDLKRAAHVPSDVILFNIDSRADASEGRTAILSVFWRVFNEIQGFSGESLPLADLERYLKQKGKYQEFLNVFQEIYGSRWQQERDAYSLLTDEIVEALSRVLGKDKRAAQEWFEKLEERFHLTVENFAKRVKEYLDSKGSEHRIVFLVDEVGQFIGEDSQLMLNLQTITEELGRLCRGRAWVMVTSQEDIDATLGNLKAGKANDFSKIQGRFRTRLSLSSANTDEVIQKRLLEKKDEASKELESIFRQKGDIINNQISFTSDSATQRKYSDERDFAVNYPFVPYHFQLLQKIFESIRKAGATGMHLGRGERSMLDAFQTAAQNIAEKEVGAFAPLFQFYSCIESFLDTVVKRSITQAADNPGLKSPFDIQVLQTLFLIRYVETIKPNLDNLVTLFIDKVDADRLSIKKNLQEALARLERENLINRSGDHFFFLTDEEREVAREIKAVEIASADETRVLSELIFDDLLKGKNKHRYTEYHRDYPFHRICDSHLFGSKGQADLCLEIITPLADNYSDFNESKCLMYSSEKSGHLLVKLPDDEELINELQTLIKTDKFIRNKQDGTASPALQRILRDRATENRQRRERLIDRLETLLSSANFYALGSNFDPQQSKASSAIDKGLDHLIQNIYSKFNFLNRLHDNPQKDIRAILLSDDLGHQNLKCELDEQDHDDIKEIVTYIDLMSGQNRPIILSELVRHFASRPYGWPEWETVLLIAMMLACGKIHLLIDGAKVAPRNAVDHLTKSAKWKHIKIVKKRVADKADIKKAQNLGKEIFGTIGPEGQEKLSKFLAKELKNWKERLESFKPLADTGDYPGKEEIERGLKTINQLLSIKDDPYEFIAAFNKKKDALLDLSEDLSELSEFYDHQIETWKRLNKAVNEYGANEAALEEEDAARAFKRLLEIKEARAPYGQLKEVDILVEKVKAANDAALKEQREEALSQIEKEIGQIKALLDKKKADPDTKNQALIKLQKLRQEIEHEKHISNIVYRLNKLPELVEEAIELIEKATRPADEKRHPSKQTVFIRPSTLFMGFIETEEDMDKFLTELRQKLLKALKENKRVKLQ